MIEAGQADLLLISWLGVDVAQPRRARLPPARLRAHLPRRPAAGPATRSRYDIHVDGHANQGDVRLFFFHYDCRVRRRAPPHRARRTGRLLHRRGARGLGRRALGSRGGAVPRRRPARPAGRRVRGALLRSRPAARLRRRATLGLLRPRLRGDARARAARRRSRRAACCSSTRSRTSTRAAARGGAATCAPRRRSRPTTGSSPATSRTTPACPAR